VCDRDAVRVAALYDIHGNLPALDAVLADVVRAQVDLIVVGGDVASGPLPAQTIDRLRALGTPTRYVRGNSDREAVAAWDAPSEPADDDPAAQAAAFTASRLSRAHRDFLDRFEPTVTIDVPGLGPVLFCHGSPRSDTEVITSASPDDRLAPMLSGVAASIVVGGHTHRQFDRRVERWRMVNAGSVGVPYEGRRGAFWAVFGPDVQLRCTSYDVDAALQALRAGFAGTDELLLESLIEPADADWVAHYFEQQAIA
jgi:predicted phosphodiesterase